jgi:hypothetical protein
MPGRLLMMARKAKDAEAEKDAPVSSVDQPDTDPLREAAPHDANQEQDSPDAADQCVCPNCGCTFDNATGEILNQGDDMGEGGGEQPLPPNMGGAEPDAATLQNAADTGAYI